MTPEDIKELKALLSESTIHHADRRSNYRPSAMVMDALMRIGVGVSTSGIIGLLVFGMSMKTDMEATKIHVSNMQMQLEGFKNFTEKPRFTKEDYVQQIAPLQQMVARHDAELAQRQIWVESTNNAVKRLERDLQYISETVKEIKDTVKP